MMGGMGGMGGGGFFNVAPERVVKLKAVTVCLEHGKKDPSPHVEYKLVPLDTVAKSPAAGEVIAMLVRGELDQHRRRPPSGTWRTD
jgi:plastocyanin domain-containing protein